ncbi:MAG: HEPN domain-containing protein [Terriglobales bacterium]
MSADDPVEAYHQHAIDALALLGTAEPSLSAALRANLSKGMLLAAASFFEFGLMRHLEHVYRSRLEIAPHLAEFVIKAGMERRYHSLFAWKENNANQFFALFGEDFARRLKELVAGDDELRTAVRDFMRLGQLRNELAHENFAAYSLNLTLDEVFTLYQSARKFLAELQMQIT